MRKDATAIGRLKAELEIYPEAPPGLRCEVSVRASDLNTALELLGEATQSLEQFRVVNNGLSDASTMEPTPDVLKWLDARRDGNALLTKLKEAGV